MTDESLATVTVNRSALASMSSVTAVRPSHTLEPRRSAWSLLPLPILGNRKLSADDINDTDDNINPNKLTGIDKSKMQIFGDHPPTVPVAVKRSISLDVFCLP